MAGRPRKIDGETIEFTRDGVWTDRKHAKGERVTVSGDLADFIVGNDHARRV